MKYYLSMVLLVIITSINLYSQKIYSYSLEIPNDTCNGSPFVVLGILNNPSKVDVCVFTLCDEEIYAYQTVQYGTFEINNNLNARLTAGNPANSAFSIVFSSSVSGIDMYELSKQEGVEAVLKEITLPGQGNTDLLANEYFNFTINSSNLFISKRKDFICTYVKLLDLQGKVVQSFDYDNYNYFFNLSDYAAGMYFIAFQADDRELMRKIVYFK